MTPQLIDHAHIDSCIVIGCELVQPRGKNESVYFWSQSQVHNCEQRSGERGVAATDETRTYHAECGGVSDGVTPVV